MAAYIAELAYAPRRRGQLLLASIAGRYSNDATLSSALADPALDPLLFLPGWGLEDGRQFSESDALTLTEAVAYEFLAIDLLETDQAADASDLARILQEIAGSLFHSVVGDHDGFWKARDAIWQRHQAAQADELDGEELLAGDRAVVLQGVVGSALDIVAGSGRRIGTALMHQGAALALERDLTHLRQDLVAGVTTAATATARSVAGSIDDPDLIYLVAASRQVHHGLLDRARDEARLAHQGLTGLARLSSYAGSLIARLDAMRASLGDQPPAPSRPIPRASRAAGTEQRVVAALGHARGFLLADPMLREALEVHRRDGLGLPEMTALFPLSFPLEALARNGEAVAEQVSVWLHGMASRSYAYYDHPDFDALDADTIGAVLRLFEYRADGEPSSRMIDELVGRLRFLLGDRDRIPVWLERPADNRIRLSGEKCAAVEANLLLGLLIGAPESFDEIGGKALARLFSDFAARGSVIAFDYVPEYLLVPLTKLLAAGDDPGGAVRSRIRSEIEKQEDTASPLTAAFLTIAATSDPDLGPVERSWIELLTRTQRHDGGWDAEPLFWVNGPRGGTEWFRSRTVTTGFCFDALSTVTALG